DEVGERQAPVLVFLGDRDHEPQVALHQLLHRLLITRANLAGERDLLLLGEQRSLGDLVEILVEDVALVLVRSEAGEQTPAPAATLGHPSFSHDGSRLRLGLGLRGRSRCFGLLTSTSHWSPYLGAL